MPSFVDPIQVLISLRLFFAFIVGIIIGYDRERSGKAAGIRTQMLVCVGAALIASMSLYIGRQNNVLTADPARMMSQIVVGIGFLGAGVIIKNGNKVSGVTTAATIWITAAIGIALGTGFYLPALVSTLLVLLLDPIAVYQYKYGLKGNHYLLSVALHDEKKLEKVLESLKVKILMRSIKSGSAILTIVSSQQRNLTLREALQDHKIGYDLELHED